MFQKVNYILHLNQVFANICDDERLTPFHVSLYFSLFQFWNIAKFHNPISISRDEIMRSSKIGSVNTYIRCMKQLDQWKYIQYKPSFNPQKGSQVYLFTFNKTNNNATDISINKAVGNAVKKTDGKATETPVIPSINSLNIKNKINKTKEYEPKRTKNIGKSFSITGKQSKGKKVAQKKEIPEVFVDTNKNQKTCQQLQPTLSEIKKHFVQKKWPELEAEKFYNYYQSNGWLVGGKTPMQNWEAATKNWMLNSEKFTNGKTKQQSKTSSGKSGRLSTNENKNYAEPL